MVLSHTSNLMLWGPTDTLPTSPERGATHQLLLSLCKEVFREYQRALWDPEPGASRRS
jgi:hypothetical protein